MTSDEINKFLASLGIKPLFPDDLPQGDPLRIWLERKPRTIRYMTEAECAELFADIEKEVAEFRLLAEQEQTDGRGGGIGSSRRAGMSENFSVSK